MLPRERISWTLFETHEQIKAVCVNLPLLWKEHEQQSWTRGWNSWTAVVPAPEVVGGGGRVEGHLDGKQVGYLNYVRPSLK